MRLLLDTHVAIWALTDRARIPQVIVDVLDDTANPVFVSAVSIWEIAIKHRLRRTDSPPFSGRDAIGHFENAGFTHLSVTATHAAFVEQLPAIHNDPFDRLLLAQAMVEHLQLVTFDRQLGDYDAAIITW